MNASDATIEVVLGTGNAKKLRELEIALQRDVTPSGQTTAWRLSSLADYPDAIEVDETGDTFEANATLKACQQAKHLDRWVVADDSGLAVDAIDGQPGVHSARYAGTHGDDEANNQKLLAALSDVPPERRDASFVCVLCLSDPSGNVRAMARGHCRGRIIGAAQGRTGFGYDPLFLIREYHRTFAELDLRVKRAISHRAVAMRKFVPQMIQAIAESV